MKYLKSVSTDIDNYMYEDAQFMLKPGKSEFYQIAPFMAS